MPTFRAFSMTFRIAMTVTTVPRVVRVDRRTAGVSF
jgi:hypothetical protein